MKVHHTRITALLATLLAIPVLCGNAQSQAPTNAPLESLSTNSVASALVGNSTNSAPPLPKGKDPAQFFHWLRDLGVDSNKVEQIKVNNDMQRFYDLLDEYNPGATKVKHLVNSKDLSPFYTWLEKDGVYRDPDSVFTVTNGMIRISGRHFGYLATKAIYSDYRLIAEYKWGTAKWGKKADMPRNSGLCIHGTGLDKIWMKSIECQIAEGETGDVVVHDGSKLTVDGLTLTRPWATFYRDVKEDRIAEKPGRFKGPAVKDTVEKPTGEWNTIEVVCEGGRVRVMVNGKVTLDGAGAWPNMGRILLQSNGAEIFFRRLDVHPMH